MNLSQMNVSGIAMRRGRHSSSLFFMASQASFLRILASYEGCDDLGQIQVHHISF